MNDRMDLRDALTFAFGGLIGLIIIVGLIWGLS